MELGFWEIALICLFIFLFYGEKFPTIARKAGRFINQIKKVWEEEIKS